MTTIRKRIASLLAVVLCLSLLSVSAGAYSRVDTQREVSLSLRYTDTERNVAVSGMELRVYQVAQMSDAVRFTLTEAFRDYPVSLEDMTQDKWRALAGTLAGLVAQDGEMTPTATVTTDENGLAAFPGLSVGLYLVTGSAVTANNYTYTPQSVMLTLPSLGADDAWIYDLEATGKYTRSYNDPGGGGESTVSRSVLKTWEDAGSEADRPSQVTVQLLRNGSVYDTVTLNEANNWRHSWTGLSASADWQVTESNVPENYTVLVSQEGTTFMVTNTATTDIEDPDTPLGPGEEDPGELPEVDMPEEEVPLGNLPQTGILWWPVQVLAIAGILLFFAGWMEIRRGKKNRDEA